MLGSKEYIQKRTVEAAGTTLNQTEAAFVFVSFPLLIFLLSDGLG